MMHGMTGNASAVLQWRLTYRIHVQLARMHAHGQSVPGALPCRPCQLHPSLAVAELQVHSVPAGIRSERGRGAWDSGIVGGWDWSLGMEDKTCKGFLVKSSMTGYPKPFASTAPRQCLCHVQERPPGQVGWDIWTQFGTADVRLHHDRNRLPNGAMMLKRYAVSLTGINAVESHPSVDVTTRAAVVMTTSRGNGANQMQREGARERGSGAKAATGLHDIQ